MPISNNLKNPNNGDTFVFTNGDWSLATGGGTGGGGGVKVAVSGHTITSGTALFSNSNGVSFGGTGQFITASVSSLAYANSHGISFGISSGTLTASVASQSNYVFQNSNNVSFSTVGSNVVASASYSQSTQTFPAQTTQTQNVVVPSAGTQTATSGTVVFSNSNGISFGMSGSSRITASYTVPSTAGLISAVNVSAGSTSNNLTNLVFSNSNQVTFGISGSTVTASIPAIPTTAGLLSRINVSAGTTSNNLSAFTLSNSNGLAFGLNGSVITGSYSQAAQTANTFSNSNNVSFTNNAGVINASASFPTQTSLNYSNANGATFGIAGSTLTLSYTVPSTAGLLSAIKVSAGTQSSNLSAITLSNSNGLAFGLSNGTITGSYTVPSTAGLISNINISGGTTSSNVNSIVFSNANNFSFGLSNNTITASYTVPSTVGLISGISVTAGGSNQFLTQLQFSNDNGIAFGLNATAISASLALNIYAASNSTVSSSGTVPAQSFSIVAQNGAYAGISGNKLVINALKGLYYNRLNAQVVNYVLVKGDEGAIIVQESGSAITITVPPDSSVAWQQQRITVYNDAGGQITIVAGVGVTLTTTSTLINTKKFGFIYLDYIGPNEWSVSGDLVGAYAINVSAGTTNSNATNFSFANSNGVSFGLNGQTITASYSQSTVPGIQASNNISDALISVFSLGNGSVWFQPLVNPGYASFSQMQLYMSNAYGTSNVTFNGTVAYGVGIYTRTGQTLSLATSASSVLGFTGSGTNLSSIFAGGISRIFTMPLAANLTPGNYWLGFLSSTSISTAQMMTFSNLGPVVNAAGWGFMGQGFNSTNQAPLGYGFQVTTTTAVPNSIAFSQIVGNISPRIVYGYELRNF